MKFKIWGIEFSFSCFNPACDGKIKYRHKATALQAANVMNVKPTTRRPLEPYRCDACGKWHLGGTGG